MAVDADEFDRIVNTWAAEQADRRGRSRVAEDGTTGDDDATDPCSTGSTPDEGGNTVGANLV